MTSLDCAGCGGSKEPKHEGCSGGGWVFCRGQRKGRCWWVCFRSSGRSSARALQHAAKPSRSLTLSAAQTYLSAAHLTRCKSKLFPLLPTPPLHSTPTTPHHHVAPSQYPGLLHAPTRRVLDYAFPKRQFIDFADVAAIHARPTALRALPPIFAVARVATPSPIGLTNNFCILACRQLLPPSLSPHRGDS